MVQPEIITIASTQCKLFATPQPEFLLVQPSARHEEKGDGVAREMQMLRQLSPCGFVMATFDTNEWARALMPWRDDAVSRDEEVGLHSRDTLCFILNELLPVLRSRYGNLPCIIGGYSLGGLFALWAARPLSFPFIPFSRYQRFTSSITKASIVSPS